MTDYVINRMTANIYDIIFIIKINIKIIRLKTNKIVFLISKFSFILFLSVVLLNTLIKDLSIF